MHEHEDHQTKFRTCQNVGSIRSPVYTAQQTTKLKFSPCVSEILQNNLFVNLKVCQIFCGHRGSRQFASKILLDFCRRASHPEEDGDSEKPSFLLDVSQELGPVCQAITIDTHTHTHTHTDRELQSLNIKNTRESPCSLLPLSLTLTQIQYSSYRKEGGWTASTQKSALRCVATALTHLFVEAASL